MRLLRWAGEITLEDRVKNTHVRGSFNVAPVSEKFTKSCLRWYGHVMRRPDTHMDKVELGLKT